MSSFTVIGSSLSYPPNHSQLTNSDSTAHVLDTHNLRGSVQVPTN